MVLLFYYDLETDKTRSLLRIIIIPMHIPKFVHDKLVLKIDTTI